ncbi:MAG TPA: family 1 glycosylhydrolase [Puia sp.]
MQPELWGGIECTINRIGNEYKDQLSYSDHYKRPDDIESFASLGIKAIRYPILWEKHEPQYQQPINWRWTDGQLKKIQDTGMTPIAGLLHHGSGPLFTNLLDPSFPQLLAEYAYKVARRFPWLTYYTPVNEPLTTARFSGLYGHWFPHHRNDLSFYKMILNQLKAIVLSMEAIRSVNSGAKLIQTEDLGKTHSTPLLAHQASFENERRWLTFDLLTGKLNPESNQYQYMLGCGIREDELRFFHNLKVKPDILGLNYYVTSERWLDEAVENYSSETIGGNTAQVYADTEVVRVYPDRRFGFRKLAQEVWERYGIAMAATEVHLHCTRDEQMRWFKEIWDDALSLCDKGIHMKAVTAWSLLGSFDWDSLLTKTGTQYESGIFDIKTFSGHLRKTGLVNMLQQISAGRAPDHAVLKTGGWWSSGGAIDQIPPLIIYVPKIPNRKFSPEQLDYLKKQFSDTCGTRRIYFLVLETLEDVKCLPVKPWAIIDLGENPLAFSNQETKNVSLVNFRGGSHHSTCLTIGWAQRPLTIHQVNKILDLLIDGETGFWIFDSGGIIFKSIERRPANYVT